MVKDICDLSAKDHKYGSMSLLISAIQPRPTVTVRQDEPGPKPASIAVNDDLV